MSEISDAGDSGRLLGTAGGRAGVGPKAGRRIEVYFFDSPASMSIHEETTIAGQGR